jgi:hypothetical protein
LQDSYQRQQQEQQPIINRQSPREQLSGTASQVNIEKDGVTTHELAPQIPDQRRETHFQDESENQAGVKERLGKEKGARKIEQGPEHQKHPAVKQRQQHLISP